MYNAPTVSESLSRLRRHHAQKQWLDICRADIIFCCYEYLSDGKWRTERDIWAHILSLGLLSAFWTAVGHRVNLHDFMRRHMTYILIDVDVCGYRHYHFDTDTQRGNCTEFSFFVHK